MKKVLAVILALVLSLTAFLTISTTAFASETTYNILENKDKFKINGRYLETATGVTSDWSGSGIEFSANCSGTVSVSMTLSSANGSECFYTVFVDGTRLDKRLRIASGGNSVDIVTDLESGTHTFKLAKQSEMTSGLVNIQSVTLDGTLNAKPDDKNYYMEFIGDSISAGNSALCLTGSDDATARHSDGTRTYCYLTAENFDADSAILAISGSRYSGMLTQYDYVNYSRDSSASYTFDRKPNVVVINLGTNDGTQSVSYYQSNASSFITKIRNKYNDQTIPIVFYHTCMQADYVRANLTAGLKNLGGEENGLYSLGGTRSGTHPRMDTHKTLASRLSTFLVNKGIMPKDALRDDATCTLSENTTPKEIDYGTTPFTYNSDGTGTSSIINSLKYGAVKNNYKNVYGIKFNLNYTGNLSKNIYITSSDKKGDYPFEAVEGQDNEVVLTWEYMPSALTNLYVSINGGNSLGEISFDFGTDVYSCTLSNLEFLQPEYSYTNNANGAYTTSNTEFEVYGNLSGYVAQTTTVAQTTSPTVPTQSAYDYTYDCVNCSPVSSAGALNEYDQTDATPNGKVSQFTPNTVGDTVDYTITGLPAGSYKLYILSRDYSGRGTYSVAFNSEVINQGINFAIVPNGSAQINTREVGTVVSNGATNTIQLKNTVSGGYYIQKFYFTSTTPSSTTSTAASSTTSTSATVAQTTSTTSSSAFFEVSDVSNPANWQAGQYSMNFPGDIQTYSGRACVSKKVKVEYGTSYTFSTGYTDDLYKYVIREYTSSGAWIKSFGVLSAPTATYTPSGNTVGAVGITIYCPGNETQNLKTYIDNGTIKPSVYKAGEAPTTTTTTTTTAVPGEILDYPTAEGFLVDRVINTFDSYTGEQHCSYITYGNGSNSYNANSWCITKTLLDTYNFDDGTSGRYYGIPLGTLSTDTGCAIRFWYKASNSIFFRLRSTSYGTGTDFELTLPAAPNGTWYTLNYSTILSANKSLSNMKYMFIKSTGGYVYIDEVHTLIEAPLDTTPTQLVSINGTDHSIKTQMVKGGAMRYFTEATPTLNGIRFSARYNTADIQAIIDCGYEITDYGTTFSYNGSDTVGGKLVQTHASGFYKTEDGYSIVAGSMVGIKEDHITGTFSGIGYLVFTSTTDENDTITLNSIANDNDRSIAYIAYCVQNGSEYDGLSKAQQDQVDTYADKYVA